MDTTLLLTGALPGILIVAAVFAAPISFGLIWLYRRTVIGLMSRRVQPAIASSPTDDKAKPQPPPTGIKPEFVSIDNAPISEKVQQFDLLRNLRFRRWQAAAIYIIGGLCFGGITALAMLLADQVATSPLRLLYLTWVFLFPTCLVVNLVASTDRRTGVIVLGGYFAIWLMLTAIEIAISPRFDLSQAITIWATYNLPATILITAFLYRRIRAIGPMVFTFLVFGFAGDVFLTSWLLNQMVRGVKPVLAILAGLLALGLSVDGVVVLIYVLSFIVVALVGWFVLQVLKWLYLRNRQSDQSLILDPIWLSFAFLNSESLVFNNPWWLLSGLLAFGVYKTITWVGFAWLNRKRRKTRGIKLLILRVFSLGKRSDQLYSAIAKAWRYVGTIRFITGPDLAASTVEPNNFLDFVSGRLRHCFIDSAATLERRVAGEDVFPELDGRHRVSDFFCYDDTWKMVLGQLVEDSDTILMDLRQFSAKHAGCTFEIHELTDSVPLKKVVFVVDNTTDEDFLRKSVEDSCDKMSVHSPNRKEPPTVRLFNYSGSRRGEFDQMLRALSIAVD